MARFRFQMGSLADSKATEIEVNSLQELMDYYNSEVHRFFRATKLKCKYYGTDDRPGGYPLTYIVTAEYVHKDGEYTIGFSDELLS